MAKELRRIAYDEFAAHINSIFDRLVTDKEPVLIEKEGEDLAVLRPAKPAKRIGMRGKPLTKDDPFSILIGSAVSDPPTDARKIHEYLTDALAPHRP
ncbi:MAG: type II toxin-antitoxin system Phd/YefM family antitoxin [Chloroflexota bacterium]|nr:MAG: type II toxin-antitoxin system Phd/YefM family antitoxin [Chloroflexota bacterium]